ncbi:hypothetical protein [Actinoplanes teichomyceticus]|uniref:Uncharacterized protein n=1 Tax=Actinoplanes teichomyceticus TaxID=1867 RepID=A0A561W9P3_ACTTI|nr:hypothetical protein [Actinoplanes teichomyceticus]TWG20595.1 hypothetical protein FHX34_103123 [Actinoplanes teichomyceticus]GIF15931.1 hypothetical protein Ate01nite_59630 [Actinoplanes teichomyceticus]
MTDSPRTPNANIPRRPGEQTGPEYDAGGDFEYDEAHGAGEHPDVPAALVEEAERRRAMSPPR